MKTNQILSAALAIVALASSCKKDDHRILPSKEGIQFTSQIVGNVATKASGSAWGKNDEIGVFMKQGAGLEKVLASNKMYTTPGDGNFSATGANIINFLDEGKVDFIAYYPFVSALESNNLPINIADQSSQEKIDVMYSNNAVGLDKASEKPSLVFEHKLAKIEFNVSAGEGVDNLSDLKVEFRAVNTKSAMDLATGAISEGENSANVNAKINSVDSKKSFVETILIPGDYAGKEIIFSAGGESFEWKVPADIKYETGKRYTYNVNLMTLPTPKVAVTGTAVITDWNAVSGGTIDLKNFRNVKKSPEPTGIEQTLFQEKFGEISANDSKVRFKIGKYDRYENKSVKYSDLYADKTSDIRRTKKLPAHVWFPTKGKKGFKIDGLKAEGFKDIVLTFDLAGDADGMPANGIKVKVNGKVQTLSGVLGAKNKFSEQKISGISAENNLSIEFEAENNEQGYRLSNIKIVGKK